MINHKHFRRLKLITEFIAFLILSAGVFIYTTNGRIIPLSLSAIEFIEKFPVNDLAYQLKFALDYIDGTAILPNWVLNLWPPGLSFIDTAIILLFGEESFTLTFYMFAIFLYSVTFFALFKQLSSTKFSPIFFVICAVSPLLIFTFQESLFTGYFFMTSDYICFLLLTYVWIFLNNNSKKIHTSLFFAVFILVIMAYVRTFYFSFFYFLITSITFIFLLKSMVLICKNKVSVISYFKSIKIPLIKTIAIFFLGWMMFLPWKIFYIHYYQYN
jgi:hypothetical protein